MKSFFPVILIASLFCLDGCYDKQYSPYFHNESGRPVHMTIGYTPDHPPTTGTLPPHTNGGHAEKDLVISSIIVKYDGGPEYSLKTSDIKSLRAVFGELDLEVWIISESGVRLGNKSDWKKINAN